MRLYVDQMLRVDFADRLRRRGHDVVRAAEVLQDRADDAEILAYIIREDRVLVTLDEHFGDWAILPLDKHPGVIRLKIHPPTTNALFAILDAFLQKHSPQALRDHLIILSSKRERWIRTGKK